MTMCTECGAEMERFIKPEHIEDLGGVVVRIHNAVLVERCLKCGEEESTIPDMKGLVCAAALLRALNPVRLSGKEIKFVRRALGMTQRAFAAKVDVKVETVSRWENEVQGCGAFTEKTLRHNVCALLHAHAPAISYDPLSIVNMTFEASRRLDPIELERATVKMIPSERGSKAWDLQLAA